MIEREDVLAIQGLQGQMERLTTAVTELRVTVAADVALLKAASHKQGDCPAIVQMRNRVEQLWDGRNKFLGVTAGIGIGAGIGAGMGTAGVLKLLGG